MKNAIANSYPRSDIRADGQVVKISFSDGMKFEILPAFQNKDILPYVCRVYGFKKSPPGGGDYEKYLFHAYFFAGIAVSFFVSCTEHGQHKRDRYDGKGTGKLDGDRRSGAGHIRYLLL